MNPMEISSAEFRHLADRVAQLATEYLENLDALPVAPATTGEESLRLFDSA